MKLYDKTINELLLQLQKYNSDGVMQMRNDVSEWSCLEREQLILKNEMAFELGGSGKEAVSALAFTKDEALVPQSGVSVIGPDLCDMNRDCDYARMTLVRLRSDEDSQRSADDWYALFRKIDFVRYHMYPEGYMMRISSVKEREPVRIAKESVKKGISLWKVGACFVKAYEQIPEVAAVQTIFVTQTNADYKQLKGFAHNFEQITDSLNHIYENINMDCSSCGLKPVCDEVEGLRELHFSLR